MPVARSAQRIISSKLSRRGLFGHGDSMNMLHSPLLPCTRHTGRYAACPGAFPLPQRPNARLDHDGSHTMGRKAYSQRASLRSSTACALPGIRNWFAQLSDIPLFVNLRAGSLCHSHRRPPKRLADIRPVENDLVRQDPFHPFCCVHMHVAV